MSDDDWNDGTILPPAPSNRGEYLERGRKYTSGRGFKTIQADDEWGTENEDVKGYSYTGWDNAPTDINSNEYHEGRAGRSGGCSGRGGRGGCNNGESNTFEDDNEDNFEEGNRRCGRGGGRGRVRGAGCDGDFDSRGRNRDGKDPHNDDRPRELYIPVERTTDEELFSATIMSGINFMKMEDIEVNVSGAHVPPPLTSFERSGLRPLILENVKKSKYTKPTPIQRHAIPIIMDRRDLMGSAQTGSGKTVRIFCFIF